MLAVSIAYFSIIRGMLHDEEVYNQPHNFIPARFLNDSDEYGSIQPDPRGLVYGFGPRCVCTECGHQNNTEQLQTMPGRKYCRSILVSGDFSNARTVQNFMYGRRR